MLKQLKRVLVQFSPWSREGRSAREFLSRLQAAKAQASNPDCKIESRIRVKGLHCSSLFKMHASTSGLAGLAVDVDRYAALQY